MSVSTANASVPSGAASAAAIPKAIVQPVADASRKVHHHVTGGLQWYLEQWEDVVAEVKAERAVASTTLDDILSTMPQARIASDIPGRVRLRTAQLKGQARLAPELAATLAGVAGISRAEVSHLTGSVLIYYDTAKYRTLDALLQAVSKRLPE